MPLIPLDDPLLRGGSGGNYYKFTTPGETVQGTVVDARKTQQTDFDSGEPLTFEDGSPRMQFVITVQTAFRNSEGLTTPIAPGEDKGLRDLYVKMKDNVNAMAAAIEASGASGLDVGGTFVMQYSHDQPNINKKTGRAGFPTKIYAFAYQAPPAVALGQIAQPVVQQAPPVVQQAPVVQPGVQPSYGQLSTPAGVPQAAQPLVPQLAHAQVPGIGQLMGQQQIPQPPVAAPVAQAPAAAPTGRTPEQEAALAALSPEQRALLGLA